MIYGYARVSTADQNLDRQKDALNKYGIDRLYCEKILGTKKNRPELDAMLRELRDGDTIVIESLSRLGRKIAVGNYLESIVPHFFAFCKAFFQDCRPKL